jgi:flagellar protein FlaG
MDIGGVKLAPAAAPIPAANRVEPTASGARAVATELPREEAVRAIGDSPNVRIDIGNDKAREQIDRERMLRSFIRNRNEVDPRTRELVFRAIDTRTGEVVRQFPDETRLKLREYINRLREARAGEALASPSLTRSA